MNLAQHQAEKHLNRSKYQEFLGEFVYGGIDGSVTTFAVVAGSAGANLDTSVILILGLANLLADGFSMSIGAYLSTKSGLENYEKHRRTEYQEITEIPDIEREEIREIYRAKGFEGELLEKVVDVITADKDRWVDVMMKDELGMIPEQKSPLAIGAVTYLSFIVVGLVPLISYLFYMNTNQTLSHLFSISIILTSITFAGIGFLKAVVTETSRLRGIIETLLLGGSAAAVAYFVGDVLERMIVG
ncbi:MAG: VIT1/CCC1 transporter family protein [Bacteroidia bacterium]|nr:VIT1/CCC1 transporter family protein [Bacteroidia bacterium]